MTRNTAATSKIGIEIVFLLLLSFPLPADADIPFHHTIVDSRGPKDPWAKIVGDIDGDGFVDIIVGGRAGPLLWYCYPDWTKAVVAEGGYRTVDGEVGDIDGDGDLDVVMGGLIWYENPRPGSDPAKKPWRAHTVANHPTHDVELGDLDGDGDLDIVTRDQSEFGHKAGNKIYLWRQNTNDTWTKKVIDCPHGEAITLGDIDKDGDPDLVIGGAWYENDGDIVDGAWTAHHFANWHPNATVQVADINGDALPDVVLSPSELRDNFYRISWFERPSDPKQGNWTEHIIARPVECVIHGLGTADMNGDGAIDVVAAEMHQSADPDEVVVYINQAKGSSWKKQVVSTKGSHFLRCADIGNDSDIDIIGANWSGSYQPIELWENKSEGWVHLSSRADDLPDADVGRQAASLVLDIDKDGVKDFVIAGWSKETSMVWFRRNSTGWQRYLIDNRQSHIEAGGAYWDIDADGDLDILQGACGNNQVWWWENPYPDYDPDKPWQRHTIKDYGPGQHHDQIFGDFDGDGRAELVFWNQKAQKLLIADIPANPKVKEDWSFTKIWSWPLAFKYEGLAKADIDLDGKTDLIGGGMWFKHKGGKEFAANMIDENYGMSRSAAGDLIKGGRPEIVLNSGDGVGPLNLYEWKTNKWVKHTLIERVDHGHTLQVGDMDGDGNLDIYAAEMYRPGAGENCRHWILCGDGKGKFTTQVVSVGIGTHEGRTGDLDGDGDLDILQKDFQEHQRVDIWLNNGTYKAKGPWWNEAHKYRVPIRIRAAGYAREDKPVEVTIHFTQFLNRLGTSGRFDEDSIRVVEVDTAGNVIESSIGFQFDQDPHYNPRTNAKGALTVMLDGKTQAYATRIFHVYFGGRYAEKTFQPLVSVTDNIQHEGQDSYKIEAPNATYYYHKQGAGFASIVDKDGNDWVSYNPGVGPTSKSGSGGKYRGIPNMGHPEGYCHPGSTKSSSRLICTGPIKARIFSESNDKKWACLWDVFPNYVTMTVLRTSHPYWFLYEGTPGGRLDTQADQCIRVNGQQTVITSVAEKWQGDLRTTHGLEWLAFADPSLGRSLLIVHHTDDEAIDSYWPMNQEMTVFGFGRLGLDKYIRAVPAHFTLGLVESTDADRLRAAVNDACQPLNITLGPVEARKAE